MLEQTIIDVLAKVNRAKHAAKDQDVKEILFSAEQDLRASLDLAHGLETTAHIPPAPGRPREGWPCAWADKAAAKEALQ